MCSTKLEQGLMGGSLTWWEESRPRASSSAVARSRPQTLRRNQKGIMLPSTHTAQGNAHD